MILKPVTLLSILSIACLSSCGKSVGKASDPELYTPAKSTAPSTTTSTVPDENTDPSIVDQNGNVVESFSVLETKIHDVMNMESVWPGYPTWNGLNVQKLPAKRGAQAGVTWPHRFVTYVAKGMGANVDLVLKEKDGTPSIDWTSAVDMANALKNVTANGLVDVIEVSDYYAQTYANEGKVVVAVAWMSKKDQKVRLGVVSPNKEFYDNQKGAFIAASAPEVKIYTHQDWVAIAEEEPRYYLLPKKTAVKLAYYKAASTLSAKIDEVINRPLYKTTYQDPKQTVLLGVTIYAEGKIGNNWSGYSTYQIVKEMGLEPRALTGLNSLPYVSLVDMINKLDEGSKLKNNRWVNEVDAQTAQTLANQGEVVLVTSVPTTKFPLGHMAVVYPDSKLFDAKLGATLAQLISEPSKMSTLRWRLELGLTGRFFQITQKASSK